MPKLITHVETRLAQEQDAVATADIHQVMDDADPEPAAGAQSVGDPL